MPAVIAHYLFTLRVIRHLKRAGFDVENKNMALIGAQGPDIFFYHRALPWQRGESYAEIGSKLHRASPAKLFNSFANIIRKEDRYKSDMKDYMVGFFCHYALDRAIHPYVYYMQTKLRKEEPNYGKSDHQYHFRIESALDTLTLKREIGRDIRRFDLRRTMPSDMDKDAFIMGNLYRPVIYRVLSEHTFVDHIAHAPKDMRYCMGIMTDKNLRKRNLLKGMEKVVGKGPLGSSLLRPAVTSGWDYANQDNELWVNPFDKNYSSYESFFDLFDFSVGEAVDMITAFAEALTDGRSMMDITQDRGFSSDLSGIYDGGEDIPNGFYEYMEVERKS